MITEAVGIFAVLFGADQVCKQYIEDHMKLGEEKDLIDGKIVVRKEYNRGFLLNQLDDKPEVVKTCTIATGIALLLYNIQLFSRRGHRRRKLGMAIASAGAASNIFDRLVRGQVIDYIGIKCKNTFLSKITANLGDFFILIGGLIGTKF